MYLLEVAVCDGLKSKDSYICVLCERERERERLGFGFSAALDAL